MRCASLRFASVVPGASHARSAQHGAQREHEATSRGTNHRSEIGSYHLPISISTIPDHSRFFTRLEQQRQQGVSNSRMRQRSHARAIRSSATRCEPECSGRTSRRTASRAKSVHRAAAKSRMRAAAFAHARVFRSVTAQQSRSTSRVS